MPINLFTQARRTGLTILLLAVGWFIPPAQAFNTAARDEWPLGSIPLVLSLGTADRTLLDGNTSWDDVARDAAADWNRHLGLVQLSTTVNNAVIPQQGDGYNSVAFSDTIYGDEFGDETLAVTLIRRSGNTVIAEADVLVNKAFPFDSYRGVLQEPGAGHSLDLRRVLLHEFGHVLGLDHPDKIRQQVTAVMNSVVSDTDDLTDDDILGSAAIYGDPALKSVPVKASDVVVDDRRARVYASTSKHNGKGQLKVIDPYLAAVAATVNTGSGPKVLALSGGGEHLYLGVDGPGVIDQIDPDTFATTLEFHLGAQAGVTAAVIKVLPGQPEAVLVSQVGNILGAQQHNAPANGGDYAVYDRGVLRAQEEFDGSDNQGTPIFLDETGQAIYAFLGGFGGAIDGSVSRLTLGAAGISPDVQRNYLQTGSLKGVAYDRGLLFVPDDGSVIDVANKGYLSGFPGVGFGSGAVIAAADAALGQVYFVETGYQAPTGSGGQYAVQVFDMASRAELGIIALPRDLQVLSVRRWGVNGLLLGLNGKQMLFIRSNLIAPGPLTGGLQTVALGAPKPASLDENGPKGKLVVTRAGDDLSVPLDVHYTVTGTAQNGVDYRMLSGVVTIPAGEVKGKIKIFPAGEHFGGGSRSIQVDLTPDLAYRQDASPRAVITLTDNGL